MGGFGRGVDPADGQFSGEAVVRRRPSRAALVAAAITFAISVLHVAANGGGGGTGGTPAGSGADVTESSPAQVINSDIKLAY